MVLVIVCTTCCFLYGQQICQVTGVDGHNECEMSKFPHFCILEMTYSKYVT